MDFRGLWNISVDNITLGGRVVSARRVMAGRCLREWTDPGIGSVWKMDPRLTAVARYRIRIRSIATSTRSGHGQNRSEGGSIGTHHAPVTPKSSRKPAPFPEWLPSSLPRCAR
jgi:hypothetical protein